MIIADQVATTTISTLELSTSFLLSYSRVYALQLPCLLPLPLLLPPPPLFPLNLAIIPTVRNSGLTAPERDGVFAPATLPNSVIDARKSLLFLLLLKIVSFLSFYPLSLGFL